MRSKTSCCNGALLRKNITRFAPVWGLYTLCLIMGILLIYTNGGEMKEFHYASNLVTLPQIMSVVNLVYAAVVAQLLFGDLFNSRMCYPLHAFPVRRGNILAANTVAGMLFSLVPTAIMTILAVALTRDSVFADAWQIPLYGFAAANLQYLFFFGLSVFCVMCTGNRLAMVILYGLFNFGAGIAYWLIDTIYTPMLYGVVTPTRLAENLTPILRFSNDPLMEADNLGTVRQLYQFNWEDAVAHFTVTDRWTALLIWAGVGIVFFLLAMVLYRKRDLECAGDALAFKKLEPVFRALVAVVSACFAYGVVSVFIGYMEDETQGYLFLAAGLVVGWFACQMLIDRSTRVFQFKNWLRLAALTGVLTLSLVLTHYDVLGIAEWQPDVDQIRSIQFGGRYTSNIELTEKEDILRVLQMQREALEERLTQDGPYVQAADGSYVYNIDSNSYLLDKTQWEITDCRFVSRMQIEYVLKSGKTVSRVCWIWADGPGADDAREFLSRWDECINRTEPDGTRQLAEALATLTEMYVDGYPQRIENPERTLAEGLVEAIQKDCAEHNMAQNYTLHTGYFHHKEPDEYGNQYNTRSLYIYIGGKDYGWSVEIYPDSRHTVQYLQENDLFCFDIMENNLHYN